MVDGSPALTSFIHGLGSWTRTQKATDGQECEGTLFQSISIAGTFGC